VQTLKTIDESDEKEVSFVSEETLLHLFQTHPKLAMKLIEEQFSEKKVSH
jgi:hypothetical protein